MDSDWIRKDEYLTCLTFDHIRNHEIRVGRGAFNCPHDVLNGSFRTKFIKGYNGKFVRKQLEVDFVLNRPPYRVYIQSAFHMPTPEKEQQERRPLLSINDHFRKIVIVGDDIHRKEDELGVLTIGLLDFLTDKNLLEQG